METYGGIITIASITASVLVYCFSTFATIRYVHQYVDNRHDEILRKLAQLTDQISKLDERLWEKDREV